ncbi:LANO_0E07646g1_1 [Lachancea nothofagi CBS 11611]|uniref:LANO_0E07646g1_1 n=1 Tax=Lachancea nothofagi CBS 11611 TaxID=1266666 RepID=A0A1G4JUN0_9SACH|nr:LANO_0E07646g1_1 [Lachancea nothofagi CBS 11611]
MFKKLSIVLSEMIGKELQKLQITAPTAVENGASAPNTCGRPNQAVTKPISLDSTTGEVMVRKSTGKTKIRKGQSTEEYESQREHFFEVEKGPVCTPEGWMTKEGPLPRLDSDPDFDIKLKQTRQKLTSHCHLLYYRKSYEECAQLCQVLISRFDVLENRKKLEKEIQELAHMLQRCKSSI